MDASDVMSERGLDESRSVDFSAAVAVVLISFSTELVGIEDVCESEFGTSWPGVLESGVVDMAGITWELKNPRICS